MDMDGTLLNERRAVSRENAEALREAARRGVHIALCSGRMTADLSCFALDAGLTDCHILGLNGACCLERPDAAPPCDIHLMDASALARCADVLHEGGMTFACFQPNRVIICDGAEPRNDLMWGGNLERANAPEYLHGWDEIKRHLPEGMCKLVCIANARSERLSVIRARLLPIPGLSVTASWSDNLELMPEGVSKGSAVRELAQRLGVPRESVMTLGDYDNDLPMIEYAGWGVAMGNASERVRGAARYVTLTNDQSGVAHAIRKLALSDSPSL